MWLRLLQHPEQLAEVRRDPDLLDAAFSETMRHSPSVMHQGRFLTEAVEMHGVSMDEGAVVRIGLASGNWDDRIFERPAEFNIFRSDLHLGLELRSGNTPDGAMHLGFGVGKHFCLGYELARTEAVVGSRLLLEAFEGRDLSLGVDPAPAMVMDNATRSVTTLPVAVSG